MKPIFLFLILMCGVCNAQSGLQTTQTILHNGINRSFIVYVPQNYTGTFAVPLLIELHGYTSNMDQQILYGDFRKIADTAGFILVVPNGLTDGNGNRYWNYGIIPGGSDDVGFLSDLIDSIASSYNINLNRVYFTGLSNGAYMCNYLACNLNSKITAIATVAGTLTPYQVNACQAIKPIPSLHIHGTLDPVVPYSGNTTSVGAEALVQHWVSFNQCNTNPDVTNLQDTDPNDNCTATHFVYSGGENGASVEFYKINGGGHTWPGAPIDITTNGSTNHDFDACKEIWRFFSQFDSKTLSNIQSETLSSGFFKIFPNPTSSGITVQAKQAKFRVQLIAASGKLIKKYATSAFKVQISNLLAGIYFIKVIQKKNIFTRKVIVY